MTDECVWVTDWGAVRISPLEAAILDYAGTRWADKSLNAQAASIMSACDKFAKWKQERKSCRVIAHLPSRHEFP